jgi:hypothetical protein
MNEEQIRITFNIYIYIDIYMYRQVGTYSEIATCPSTLLDTSSTHHNYCGIATLLGDSSAPRETWTSGRTCWDGVAATESVRSTCH